MMTTPNPMISAAIVIALVSVVAGANTTYYNPENITALVPQAATALEGIWSGNLTNSPMGPGAKNTPNLLVFSSPDPFGNFYLRHTFITQLMRFQGSNMQLVYSFVVLRVCPVRARYIERTRNL